ncbi:hypothetical protein DSO57_1032987 [Entomophthora muscae]|uniref:Uncharacterized protein n=1 Tax=Entomophthora muscae TaxID=34485 RepID=A0ACC2SPU3_9FUNG|nr:hypothetical protein DSO57_1032987 [Entomophthora muscae]
MYCQDAVPTSLIEKVSPVLDSSYEPYWSNSNKEDKEEEPQSYQTLEGQQGTVACCQRPQELGDPKTLAPRTIEGCRDFCVLDPLPTDPTLVPQG